MWRYLWGAEIGSVETDPDIVSARLTCFDLRMENRAYELHALDTRGLISSMEWRMAGREVPISATVGSTCDGIQNVRP